MNIFLRFLLIVSALSAVTYFVLQAIVAKCNLRLMLKTTKITLFHFGLSVGVISIIYTIYCFIRKYTAFAFLGTALVRMGAVVLFVAPLVKKTEHTPIADTLCIIIPYFAFTITEALFTIRLLHLANSTKGY